MQKGHDDFLPPPALSKWNKVINGRVKNSISLSEAVARTFRLATRMHSCARVTHCAKKAPLSPQLKPDRTKTAIVLDL